MEKTDPLKISKDEPIEYQIDSACQEILKSDLKASEKVTKLVNIYLHSHPDFTPVKDGFMHPSYLALYRPIEHWMRAQCGDCYVKLWVLMLAAAKEWFPDKDKTKLGHTFCVLFEIEDCTWWNGWEPVQPIVKDYLKWRYNK